MAVGLHNYIFLMIFFLFVLFVAFLWTAVFFWVFLFLFFCCELKAFEKYRSYLKWARDHFWKCCADESLALWPVWASYSQAKMEVYYYIYMCLHTYTKTGGGACKEVSINGIKVKFLCLKKWVSSSVANCVWRPLDRNCSCFCWFSLQRRPCVQHLSVVHCCHILTAF